MEYSYFIEIALALLVLYLSSLYYHQYKRARVAAEEARVAAEEARLANERVIEAERLLARMALIGKMNDFMSNSSSQSSKKQKQRASRNINHDSSFTAERILERENICLLPPLSKEEWTIFCQKVKINIKKNSSERIGVHPLVLDIVRSCQEQVTGCQYQIRHEMRVTDLEKTVTRPDISIILPDSANSNSTMISNSDMVFPIEMKKQNEASAACQQSLSYLMAKLADQLEVVDIHVHKIFGFCVGTDGHQLSIGYIALKGDVLVCSSIKNMIDLWPKNGAAPK